MRIQRAEFEYSAFRPQDLRPSILPELAFVGRSNVGKSSAINCLSGHRRLAYVSKWPGRTQALNFYRINNNHYWVDFPGYGYANRAQFERARWRALAEYYLKYRPNLRGVVLIMDSRHAPTPLDTMLMEWLTTFTPRPMIGVLSKVDLLSQRDRVIAEQRLAEWIWRHALQDIIWFSSKTGEGRPHLLAWIRKLCFEE